MLDFIRIACAVPEVKVGDVKKNAADICAWIEKADAQKAMVSNYAVLTAAEEAYKALPDAAMVGNVAYKTLQAAVDAADADDIVKLVADSDETVTVAAGKTVHLDLNGKNVAKVTIADGGKLYGMDTTTDDYDCEDGYGKIGSIDGDYDKVYRTEVTGAGKRYAAVAEENGAVSFHRFYVGITHMALRPGAGGAGYTMTLAGDSKIKSIMTTDAEDGLVYGYTVSLADLEGNPIEGAEKTCSGKQEDFLGGKQKMTALTLDGVLKASNSLDENKAHAESYLICVESFVILNGEKITTNKISMTFKEIVLATDAALNVESLTAEQKAALLYLYDDLGVKDMGWELKNLPALAAE